MRRITLGGAKSRLTAALRIAAKAASSPNGLPTGWTPAFPAENFPAGYNRWLDRTSGRARRSPLRGWTTIRDGGELKARVAVVLHVFYPELLDELLSELAFVPVDFDLIITNASGRELELSGLPNHVRSAIVIPVANHGRDILPLIHVVNAGLLDGHELVLKMHTKKSEWRRDHDELGGDGDHWRESFMTSLLGSRENVERILSGFAADPEIGVVTAPGSVLGKEFWGGDEHIVRALLKRLELDLAEDALKFPAGSMYWIRGFLLQGLYAFNLGSVDFETESGQVDGTTAHGVERLIGVVAEEAGYEIRDSEDLTGADLGLDDWLHFEPRAVRRPRARVIPFYLPQFHTFPENEKWWGEGFTEWSNVTSARPVFHGHAQPALPSTLGFYDLTSDGVRDSQYELASDAGIEGFMYYYYWFAGKRLMDKPIEALHQSSSDQPFCIMWANENWTRTWDGSEADILIGQDYEHVPASQFIADVMHLLADPRYIRVNDKPLIAIYRVTQIPNYREVIEEWRAAARNAGVGELEILTVDVGTVMHGIDGPLEQTGLDGHLEFAPHNKRWEFQPRWSLTHVDERFAGDIFNYGAMVRDSEIQLRHEISPRRFPGIMVGFDNTARRQWAPDIWYGSNPYTFRRWLNSTIAAITTRDQQERIVFVNAWNEWAENAVLEPSVRFGRTFLLAVRDSLFR